MKQPLKYQVEILFDSLFMKSFTKKVINCNVDGSYVSPYMASKFGFICHKEIPKKMEGLFHPPLFCSWLTTAYNCPRKAHAWYGQC